MDPLSLTASLITVITLTCNVTEALHKIFDLRRAPDEVLALLNEVADFRVVLFNLQDISDDLQNDSPDSVSSSGIERSKLLSSRLCEHILTAQHLLLALEKMIHYGLMVPSTEGRERPVIDFSNWIRNRRNIRTMQTDIKAIKERIHITLSLVTSTRASQVHLKLCDVQVMMKTLWNRQEKSDSVYLEVLRDIQRTLNQTPEAFGSTSKRLSSASGRIPNEKSAISSRLHGTEAHLQGAAGQDSDGGTLVPNLDFSATSSSDIFELRTALVPRSRCRIWCTCSCHRPHSFNTPAFLQNVLGSLFVGYIGSLVRTPNCDESQCQRRSQRFVRITYYFPMWFLSRAITIVTSGPKTTITAARVRGKDEIIFTYASGGNMEKLVNMFDTGLASPVDLDPQGWSLLHWAARFGAFDTCKMLLVLGADPDVENNSSITARDLALRRSLWAGGSVTDNYYEVFGFELSTRIEELQFSRLHQMLLKIVPGDLASELRISSSSINVRDSKGATPITWAAQLGDEESLQLLLEFGADPKISDYMGLTPLHYVGELSYECLTSLLDHGASPTAMDSYGETPLHGVVRSCRDLRFGRLLVTKGADLNAQDLNGWAPLHWPARYNNVEMVDLCIEHGANVNAQSYVGWTPIFFAIRYNSHQCLSSLLLAGANCSIVPIEGDSILHYAAAYADEHTMGLLAAADIRALDPDGKSYAWSEFPLGVTADALFSKLRRAPNETRASDGLVTCMKKLNRMAKGRRHDVEIFDTSRSSDEGNIAIHDNHKEEIPRLFMPGTW